ncbi:MAG TPA: IclR family transcriptional regulator [Caulobacterales bacterium]|nr:IclR family transcriptional regulator [Caulobacterales bacterium]
MSSLVRENNLRFAQADAYAEMPAVKKRRSEHAADRASEEVRQGTQTVQRAIMILRLMTRRGAPGWRLSEITKASNLPHPTTSRLLKCLVEEGLVVRDAVTKRYRLGPLNFELGLASGVKLEFREQLRPVLERIAAESGDTVYLHLRSGLEVVCIDRVDGATPLRPMTVDIGGRRPLGFGAAGVAFLAAMDEDRVQETVKALEREIANHARVTSNGMMRAVTAARANGYGVVRDTTVLGVSAVGIVLPARNGRPMLGLSIATPTERLSSARIQQFFALLSEARSRV